MNAEMVTWSESTPDVQVNDIEELVRSLSWSAAVGLVRIVSRGTRILMPEAVRAEIWQHLESESYELGGLLFGRVFRILNPGAADYPFLTTIEGTVASREYNNSSVSLRMGTEVWRRAPEYFNRGQMVVGWYHSHPNLGVFFSGVDRATQKAFFNQPYNLGLVIDPIRKEETVFFGRDSTEMPAAAIRHY